MLATIRAPVAILEGMMRCETMAKRDHIDIWEAIGPTNHNKDKAVRVEITSKLYTDLV